MNHGGGMFSYKHVDFIIKNVAQDRGAEIQIKQNKQLVTKVSFLEASTLLKTHKPYTRIHARPKVESIDFDMRYREQKKYCELTNRRTKDN